MDRDLLLLNYLHENKVASVRQINRDVFVTSLDRTRKRLRALQDIGMVEGVGFDQLFKYTSAYSITKKSVSYLKRFYPENFLIDRFRSNSVDHDLRLGDIRRVLKNKEMVAKYWTENFLQTSKNVLNDPDLSTLRGLQVDAAILLQHQEGDKLICALEYEASTKSQSEYASKIKTLYFATSIPVIFYVCKNKETEKVIKRSESNCFPSGVKKIYFASYDDVINSNNSVVFKNQNSFSIEVS